MNPFLPDEVEALRALVRTWPNAEMVVLGAAALRCAMPMSWRTTEDLDLTVAASIEEATAALSQLPGWSSDPRQEQRWRTPAGVAVDIVPASDEALASGYIEWPRAGVPALSCTALLRGSCWLLVPDALFRRGRCLRMVRRRFGQVQD